MSRYQASPELEDFILRSAPPHVVVDTNAPSSLAELRSAVRGGGRLLPVWSGGSEHTIYSSPLVNYAFRAWHDSLHLYLGAEFNPRGEAFVDRESRFRVRAAGLCEVDALAIHYDTWGQVAYSLRHDGKFPHDQAAFVMACFGDYQSAINGDF